MKIGNGNESFIPKKCVMNKHVKRLSMSLVIRGVQIKQDLQWKKLNTLKHQILQDAGATGFHIYSVTW